MSGSGRHKRGQKKILKYVRGEGRMVEIKKKERLKRLT